MENGKIKVESWRKRYVLKNALFLDKSWIRFLSNIDIAKLFK